MRSILVSLLWAWIYTTPGISFAKVLPSIKIANVPATVERISLAISDPELSSELKQMGGDHSYHISFGQITETQFTNLKVHFRKDNLNYNPKKSYTLLDFLPSKMQALMHLRLETGTRSPQELIDNPAFTSNVTRDGKVEVHSTTNCWGTAWELIRDPSANSPFIAFMTGYRNIMNYFEVPRSGMSQVKERDSIFGDLLLVFANPDRDSQLQHAAVVIGSGYFFERTDSGSATFFRIVNEKDMTGRIAKKFEEFHDFTGNIQKVTITKRFFNFSQPLPDPVGGFSAQHMLLDELQEYIVYVPHSPSRQTVTVFAQPRIGGGEEVSLYDITPFKIRINESGMGEIDPGSKGADRFKKALTNDSQCNIFLS